MGNRLKAREPDATAKPVGDDVLGLATEFTGILSWLTKMKGIAAGGELLGLARQRHYYSARAVYLLCRLLDKIVQGM